MAIISDILLKFVPAPVGATQETLFYAFVLIFSIVVILALFRLIHEIVNTIRT